MKNPGLIFPRKVTVLLTGLFFSLQMSAGDINQTDKSGQRQGYWIITGYMVSEKGYKAEDKVEEGTYLDSRKEGLWKKFFPNGKMRSEITYKEGRPAGFYKLYYDNGQLEEAGNWTNSKNTGEFRRYFPNGNPQQWFTFSDNGKRNGWQKYYHENGKLSMEVNVLNGVESGTCKRYNTDGTLSEEKTFEKGIVKPGSSKTYKKEKTPVTPKSDPYDSTIGKESVTSKDKPNKAEVFKSSGFNTLYNSNGQITQTGEFKNGKLCNGKWYRYNDNGILQRIEMYKNFKYVGNAVVSEGDL